MSFTHSILTAYTTQSEGQIASSSISVSADSEANFDGSIAGSPTADVEVDWAITLANLKSILMIADKALTIKTNATGGGAQDTIALAAGVALAWNGSGPAPFADNVTKLYVTVTGSAAAILKIRARLDQTPTP
jgi:hypothetical protein